MTMIKVEKIEKGLEAYSYCFLTKGETILKIYMLTQEDFVNLDAMDSVLVDINFILKWLFKRFQHLQ